MSEDTVRSQMKTFIDNYNMENEQDNVRYPLKDMFEQIKSDIDTIHDAITRHQYNLEGDTNSMRESVRNLNELLDKCLKISKKQRGGSKNCPNCSPADFMFLAKTARDKLQKIMPGLKETRAKVEKHMMENINISKDVQWTTGDVDESKIYGWDDQAKKIIESLVKENKEGLNVVGIVGMFGTGKTTLAQKVFVSDEVLDHFPLRLWVWVSEKCDREELLRRVLDNLGVEEDHIEEMLKIDPKLEKVGVLLFLVHLELLRKRYLIVFDDVVKVEEPWHCELDKEPPEDKEWTHRLAYGLPKGDGSAIIITSRKEDDARKMVGAGDIFTPEPLLNEDGWTLFKSSFEEVTGKPLDDKNLENLWREITRKCYGLPIALKAAGKSKAEAMMQKEKDEVQAQKQREEEAIKAESSGQSDAPE
ncbi:putative disease resistance protein [Cinnamomum micranthum f. kanehirae]|uniref:Putative disease resistance protein n=1 Tax=Cinnamomum micranthum f. kanehirae TaxID=337451 RepID=A0A443PBH9_9MAGN|nr:putative disease resistance protein [Cinnamomum micranthum f. kanehirae]